MVAPFFTTRQQIAVKVEGTEGTDAVVAAADIVAPAFDMEYTPTFEVPERPVIQPSFSRHPRIPGERSAQISFSAELKGATAAGVAPLISAALQACGFSETIVGGTSVTYAPVSVSIPSATVEIREGSTTTAVKVKKIVGARGTVVFEAVKGSPVMARFTFTGRYVEPTEGVMLVMPSPLPKPITFLAAAFTLQGVGALLVQNLNIDMGNNIVLRNDANQASGNFSAAYAGRLPVGSTDPEQVLIATMNMFNALTAGTEGVLQYVLTGAAGNIMTLNAPKTQIVNDTEGDRDTLRIENLELALNQSLSAGDDEISIAFT